MAAPNVHIYDPRTKQYLVAEPTETAYARWTPHVEQAGVFGYAKLALLRQDWPYMEDCEAVVPERAEKAARKHGYLL
jgi:hypothetical protein